MPLPGWLKQRNRVHEITYNDMMTYHDMMTYPYHPYFPPPFRLPRVKVTARARSPPRGATWWEGVRVTFAPPPNPHTSARGGLE